MIHSQIILFEDSHARGKVFKPLTYTRPFAELLVGAYSAIERIKTHANPESQIVMHVRPELAAVVKKRHAKVNELELARRTVFINARLLVTEYLFNQFVGSEDTVFRLEGQPDEILAFTYGGDIPESISQKIRNGEAIANEDVKLTAREMPKAKLFTSLWNMVNSNSVVIASDVKRIAASGVRTFSHDLQSNPRLELSGARNLYIHESAQFARKCYLNGKGGPILIEENVVCEPNVVIMGPVVIRAGTLIKAGAKIHPGITIGPVSKIGGEVENSIIQGYSNKQHDGYLGHSYIGEWCNLDESTFCRAAHGRSFEICHRYSI
jgi:serine acetyltransferase